jgi:outer membrane protein assembly factor BamB
MASVSDPVVSGGLVVVAGTVDCNLPRLTVAALDAETGRLAWQSSVGTPDPCGYGPPLHLAGDVVVAGGPLGGSADPPGPCDKSGTGVPAATGLDLATGQQRWQAPSIAGEVLAATSDTVIARGASPGCLVGLGSASGHLRWAITPPVSPLNVTFGAKSAFQLGQAPDGSLAITAVDPRTGRKQWQVPLPRSEGTQPLAVGEVVTATTNTTSQSFPTLTPGSPKPTPPEPTTVTTVTGLDPMTGRQLWHTDAQDDLTWTSVGPRVVLITHLHGNKSTVEARDPRSGVRRWQSARQDLAVAPATTDGTVVVALSERHAEGLSAVDGRPLWTVPGAHTGAAVTAEVVYLAVPTIPVNQPQGD